MTKQFGKISGYKINDQKSIFYGINISEELKHMLSEVLPTKWQEDSIKYLGTRWYLGANGD